MEVKKIASEWGGKLVKSIGFWCSLGLLIIIAVSFGREALPTSGSGKALPIYCVDTDKKQIALTFDGAWGNEDTQTLLDILKKHNVKVTFFMTGGWVAGWAYMKKLKYGVKCMLYIV